MHLIAKVTTAVGVGMVSMVVVAISLGLIKVPIKKRRYLWQTSFTNPRINVNQLGITNIVNNKCNRGTTVVIHPTGGQPI